MAKKTKVQYPDPKFWHAKDNMNWKAQGENLMEVVGIFGQMIPGCEDKYKDVKAVW